MVGSLIAVANAIYDLGSPYAESAYHEFNLPPYLLTEGIGEDPLYNVATPTFADGELLSIVQLKPNSYSLRIRNNTSQSIYIFTQHQPLVWIEALHEGQWQPIEYITRHSLDSGYSSFAPGSTASVDYTLTPGTELTSIRAAMYVSGKSFTHSKPVPASIHPLKFTYPPGEEYIYSIVFERGFPTVNAVAKSSKDLP